VHRDIGEIVVGDVDASQVGKRSQAQRPAKGVVGDREDVDGAVVGKLMSQKELNANKRAISRNT
jgi:hypothetical protein